MRLQQAVLKSLGFKSISQYRDSDLFLNIWRRVLRPGTRCFRCWKPAVTIKPSFCDHDTMSGKNIDGWVAACAKCTPWPRDYNPQSLQHILEELGFSTYSDYLKSQLWMSIRAKIIERDNATCYACGQRGTQAHHRSYSQASMSGHDLKPIVTVCRFCHEKAHRNDSGRPASLA